MKPAERAEPLYPRNSVALASCRITQEELERHIGPPHRASSRGDDEPGPCQYWSFRFPCGLHGFIAHHANHYAAFSADSAELDHLLYHLEFPQEIASRIKPADPAFLRQHYGPPENWILWRQDLHGNRFRVGEYSTLRTADCIRAQLESNVHKQVYWVEEDRGKRAFKLCVQCLGEYPSLRYDPQSRFGLSLVPFSSLVWDDEHPDPHGVKCHRHTDCLQSIIKLSSARMALWNNGNIPPELETVWDEAHDDIPNWPGFRRLEIGPSERDALKGIEAEFTSLTSAFQKDHWNVRLTRDQYGQMSLAAKATFWSKLTQKTGFSRLVTTPDRDLRKLATIVGVVAFVFCLYFLGEWLQARPRQSWPVASGRIVSVNPGPWFLFHRKRDLTIQFTTSTQTVHAVSPPIWRLDCLPPFASVTQAIPRAKCFCTSMKRTLC